MNDSAAGGAGSVADLAALLQAVALGAHGRHGRPLWESLARVVTTDDGSRTEELLASAAVLAALHEQPADSGRAEALARVLLARGEANPAFRERFGSWRQQEQARALEHAIGERPVAAVGQAQQSTSSMGAPAPMMGGLPPGNQQSGPGPATVREAAGAEVETAGRPGTKPWYRRSVVYVGAIVTPVLIATLTALATGSIQKLLGSSSSPSQNVAAPQGSQSLQPKQKSRAVPAAGSTMAAASLNSPVRVEGVTPLNNGPDNSWALASKVVLTRAQLAQLNDFTLSGKHGLLPSFNAVAVGTGSIDVTVVGNESGTVTVNGMQIVKSCQPPLDGTLFASDAQGLQSTVGLGFDLAAPIGYARNDNGYFQTGNFFQDHVVTLTNGETHTFNIIVKGSPSYYCRFTFQMSVVTPGGTVTEEITDNGRPFESTGLAHRYLAAYVGGVGAMLAPGSHDKNGAWIPANPKAFH